MTTFLQVLVLVLGLGAGLVWTRTPPVVSRDTLVNLATGALLWPIRLLLGLLGAQAVHVGLVDLRGLPGVVQFLVAFLTLDFVRYWVHRADHRVPFLWSFHRVHHSPQRLDATVGLRMHLVDFLQLSALPVLVFGILFDVRDSPWVPVAALSVGIVFDAFEHANVRFPIHRPWARVWNRFLNNPLFHGWHHVREGRLCDGNYANVLLWDRLFGTAILRDAPPLAYGLEPDQALANEVLGLQLLRPAREVVAEGTVPAVPEGVRS